MGGGDRLGRNKGSSDDVQKETEAHGWSTRSNSDGMVEVFEEPSLQARLLFSKSHVYLHPTSHTRDNIPGYLGLAEYQQASKESVVVLFWIPSEVAAELKEENIYEGYEGRKEVPPNEDDSDSESEFVFVTLPKPSEIPNKDYAFAIPLSQVYSMLVYSPSLTSWYGSISINLLGGVSLPTLYFHDDESPSTIQFMRQAGDAAVATWGATPFLQKLKTQCDFLRSSLEPRLYLINPSRMDREVHEIDLGEDRNDEVLPGSSKAPEAKYPPASVFPPEVASAIHPARSQLLSSFAQLTFSAKALTQNVFSHPLAKPFLPHLPEPVRSLITVPGEWETRRTKSASEISGEFDSARVFLARWARVVAEEGERARQRETEGSSNEAKSDLGVFEVIESAHSGPTPSTTRIHGKGVTEDEFLEWHEKGLDESHIRGEVFRRGIKEDGEARKWIWEVLLRVIPWAIGLGLSTEDAWKLREAERKKQQEEYERIKSSWHNCSDDPDEEEAKKEEWHRIDVDCRRTDRNQPIFAVPEGTKLDDQVHEEPNITVGGRFDEVEEGSQTPLNAHIGSLRTILMTYHTFSSDLGYVQGMSDLLSPLYVVYDADESSTFWAFVEFMKRMESNFLRDQSGMKAKLSTLQQLVHMMDPKLYRKLEITNSTSMFISFRGVLINYKREFKFEDVIVLWDVLFTDFYSTQFVLFVALAVLHSHRDIIIRYLMESDEVLKYINDLSQTIDVESTLAQAEVLFLSFRAQVEGVDRKAKDRQDNADQELRQRKGVKPESREGEKKTVISDDLRALLKNWRDD